MPTSARKVEILRISIRQARGDVGIAPYGEIRKLAVLFLKKRDCYACFC